MYAPFTFGLSLFLVLPSVAQDATASLTGVVQAITREGLPHALAELRSETSPGRAFRTQADNSGTYRFSGLPADEYTLKLGSAGFSQRTVKSIHISEGEQKLLPSLKLSVGSVADCGGHAVLNYLRLLPSSGYVGNLRGSVRLDRGPMVRSGPAITGADVTLICGRGTVCGSTKTNSSGEFIFTNLSPGTFTIRVVRAGFYQLDKPGYHIEEGTESVYWPIYVERCPLGNCDPRRRPKKPPARCE